MSYTGLVPYDSRGNMARVPTDETTWVEATRWVGTLTTAGFGWGSFWWLGDPQTGLVYPCNTSQIRALLSLTIGTKGYPSTGTWYGLWDTLKTGRVYSVRLLHPGRDTL